MRQAGHNYRDQAVLCTGNEKLSELGQDLERLGVPVLFLGSLFERPEIKELLSLLTILTDRRAMGLVRAACMSEFEMPISDVDALFDHLRAVDSIPGAWLGELGAITGLSETGSAALRAVAAAMRGFDQSDAPWTVLATLLLDRTRIAARIGGSSDIAERTRGLAIWHHVRNAIARFAQVQGVSDDERDQAWQRIEAAASLYGVQLHEAGWRALLAGRSAA
eukprot:gene12635-16839_t